MVRLKKRTSSIRICQSNGTFLSSHSSDLDDRFGVEYALGVQFVENDFDQYPIGIVN